MSKINKFNHVDKAHFARSPQPFQNIQQIITDFFFLPFVKGGQH